VHSKEGITKAQDYARKIMSGAKLDEENKKWTVFRVARQIVSKNKGFQ